MRASLVIILFLSFLTVRAQNDIASLQKEAEELEAAGNSRELASTLNKLGTLQWQQGMLDEAIESFSQSLSINKDLDNVNAQRIINGYLGLVHLENENYPEAVRVFTERIRLNKSAGKTQELISDYYNIAMAYQAMNNYAESDKFAELALNKSLEANNLKTTKSAYLVLAENSEKQGDSKKASAYYEKYNTISAHLRKTQMEQLQAEKEQIQTEIQVKEEQLESQRSSLADKEEAIEEMERERLLREAEIQAEKAQIEAREKLRKTQMLYLIGALVFFIIVLILFFFQNRYRKKINKRLKDQNTEIEYQKAEIERQRDLADKQRKNLTDSIQYARRIQSAVIPRQENLHNHFSDSFVLNRPRDIVSGDFYWFAQKDNIFIIAAADCTGHGVPGAFMSMLGVAYLNEIVNKIAINVHINALNADEILNQLREKVISSLHQSENKRDPKDGMDIALCIIDFDKKKLQYAGAYNPLLIIRKGELIRYNADKMPVSYHRRKDVPFTRQEIDLKDNDCLYIFSDGYIDQFGGEKGLKFLMKNFTSLLLEIHHKPMQEQKVLLQKKFEEWRGDYSQIDDVLVIGFRYTKGGVEQVSDWHDKTILIAEDTDINYFLLAEVLKKTRANLIRVKDGAEAVEIVKANSVDLVLMDINMPIMDGYKATKLIKEHQKDVPIIIQTAVHEDGQENAMNSGADDFIAKPIDLKTFMEKIARFLN
jgi:CheY-like chemotaxis protein/serine phosphatase RsbU (regulator of sigma subunit)